MTHAAASLDGRSCRSLPAGSGFLSRGGAHNIPVSAESDQPAALLGPACLQGGKLASVNSPSHRRCYGPGDPFTVQTSVAYSPMVRSVENFPEPATFKIALRDHPAESA